MKIDISKFDSGQLCKLVDNRWKSSEGIWETVRSTYDTNVTYYDNEADWIKKVPSTIKKTQSNRITPNMEAVINSVIANPPGINFVPGRDSEESEDFARKMEKFFLQKHQERNVKEDIRKGLRNLYFGRLIVLKPFWNSEIDDFDVKTINPKKIRFGKTSTKEEESEFAIEEIEDSLANVVARFPDKEEEILEKYGYTGDKKDDAYIENPEVCYKEAWIGDYLICKLDKIILSSVRNPYWDWDGILVTEDEREKLDGEEGAYGQSRRELMTEIKLDQDNRVASTEQPETEEKEEIIDPNVGHTESQTYSAYYFNHFHQPRKPYVFATILNNENSPIGRTDFISLSIPLQEAIDRRKQDIGYNAELMNGIIKVDAEVMPKSDAQSLAFQAKGVVYGKGVINGVQRETGKPLPNFVIEDMIDSRNEIDNIMAASSAFRGEREGQETKAGRLALIEQSNLRLNELVQVVDYVYTEVYNWAFQLAKTRYTERHYAKVMGEEDAKETIDLIQDDFENGSEIYVTPGKTLPVDSEFRFERAQKDIQQGIISPVDYFEEAGYNNARQTAKNAEMYKINPVKAVGISDEEMAEMAPPPQEPEKKPPSVSIGYEDLPPDAQVQLLEQIGIQANPQILIGERMAEKREKQTEMEFKRKTPQGNEIEVSKTVEK